MKRKQITNKEYVQPAIKAIEVNYNPVLLHDESLVSSNHNSPRPTDFINNIGPT